MLSPAAEQAVATHGIEAMREASRHLLARRGDLSFLRHDVQQAAVERYRASRHARWVWNWSRRLGKSWGCMTLAFEMALSGPGKRIPYAASTAAALRQYIVPIASDMAEVMPDDLRPEIVANEVRFPNGSRIVMQGCEDRRKADRLRGPSADLVIVDEAGFIPILDYVVRSVLLPQLLTTGGRMLIASTPPETAAHPFAAFAREAESRGSYSHHTIFHAPHITDLQREEICAEAGGPDSTTWKREFLAAFVTDPTKAIVPEFADEEAHIFQDIPRPEHFDAYVVGDDGFASDLMVTLFGYYHFLAATIVIEDELVLERATTDLVQSEAAEKERELWGGKRPRRRLMDTTPRTAADMAKLQDDNDPTSESRWSTADNKDRVAAVNLLRVDIRKHRLIIHPRCKVLRSHLRHGVWNEQRTDFARIKQEGTGHTEGVKFGHFDAIAACMYFVRHVDRNRNPYPGPGYDEATMFVPREVKEAEKLRASHGWSGLVRKKVRR